MASLNGSWASACGHPVEPGARFCSVCGQPTGAVEITADSGTGVDLNTDTYGKLQRPQPPLGAPVPAPPSMPISAPPSMGTPPPPPDSGTRRPWPAPEGAPPPASYPGAQPAPGTQPTRSPAESDTWLWDNKPAGTPQSGQLGAPQNSGFQDSGLQNNGPQWSGPQSSGPQGSNPQLRGPQAPAQPMTGQPSGGQQFAGPAPTTVQPGMALNPPAGGPQAYNSNLPAPLPFVPSATPYSGQQPGPGNPPQYGGPQQPYGAPQSWPQGQGSSPQGRPQGSGALVPVRQAPGPGSRGNDNDATMPGMPSVGSGSGSGNQWNSGQQYGQGGQQWGGPAGGGWPQGPGGPQAGSTFSSRLANMHVPGLKSRGPLLPAIGVGAAIVVIAAIIVAVHGSGGSSNAGSTTTSAATPASSSQATSNSQAAQQQAASQLSGLLSQSGGDRGNVDNAVVAVEKCGGASAIQQASQTFNQAAANRQTLLTKLASLPGKSELDSTMISNLTSAWQASAQADSDLAKWADDEAGKCKKGKTGTDANYKASLGPDATATASKKAFVAEWNPLAQKYSLQTYTISDI